MNTAFRPHKFKAQCDELRDEMLPEMQRHFQRWGDSSFWFGMIGRSYDIPSWFNSLNAIKNFMDTRPGYARQHIQNEFNLNKQVTIGLAVSPENAGTIDLNTITPDSLPWNGIYFDGVPITLTAKDKAGYLFEYWESPLIINGKDYNRTITYNPDSNDVFTAVYRKLDFNFTVSPNPFVSNFVLNYELPEKKQVSIQLFDINGKLVTELLNTGSFQNEGIHHLNVDAASLSLNSGVYFIQMKAGDYSKTIKVMRTRN
jgi:hypothetical protein